MISLSPTATKTPLPKVTSKVSGHKTDIAFQRYNLVTEEEMLGMKWLDLKKDEHRTMDTYMDTKAL